GGSRARAPRARGAMSVPPGRPDGRPGPTRSLRRPNRVRMTVGPDRPGVSAYPADGAVPPAVRLEGVRKAYGDVLAVAGVDLEIPRGQFFSLLGPSGSGKTTTLRMIAGFELPTGGRILLDGQDVSMRPPYERDVNTVFQ